MLVIKRGLSRIMAAAHVFVMFMALHGAAHAGYPMITDLSDQVINMGGSTPVIHFTITDDTTSPWNLVVAYYSNNRVLVPQTDDNIILGGTDAERTVQVVPAPGEEGVATITIVVTDREGGSNQDTFQVEVINPIS